MRLQDVQEVGKVRISMLESVDLIVLRTIQWQSVTSDRVALLQRFHRQIGPCTKNPTNQRCPRRMLDVATARVLQPLCAKVLLLQFPDALLRE